MSEFEMNWRYIWRHAVESFQTFFSPAKNVREIVASIETARVESADYVAAYAAAYRRLTWRIIFRAVVRWLKSLFSGSN
jgi:hypothetical protein